MTSPRFKRDATVSSHVCRMSETGRQETATARSREADDRSEADIHQRLTAPSWPQAAVDERSLVAQGRKSFVAIRSISAGTNQRLESLACGQNLARASRRQGRKATGHPWRCADVRFAGTAPTLDLDTQSHSPQSQGPMPQLARHNRQALSGRVRIVTRRRPYEVLSRRESPPAPQGFPHR